MNFIDEQLKKIATSANEQREKYGLPRIEEAAFDTKYVSREQAEKMNAGKPYIVKVDNVQVFSADFVFQQMQAQGQIIDRARHIAEFAVLVAAAAIVVAIIF